MDLSASDESEDESKQMGQTLNDHLRERETLGEVTVEALVQQDISRIHALGPSIATTSKAKADTGTRGDASGGGGGGKGGGAAAGFVGSNNRYGILLMDELLESEWLYCLKEGRKWSLKRPKVSSFTRKQPDNPIFIIIIIIIIMMIIIVIVDNNSISHF